MHGHGPTDSLQMDGTQLASVVFAVLWGVNTPGTADFKLAPAHHEPEAKETLPDSGSQEHTSGSKPVVPGRGKWGWAGPREEGSVHARKPERPDLPIQGSARSRRHSDPIRFSQLGALLLASVPDVANICETRC